MYDLREAEAMGYKMAILPGLTHYNIFASPALVAAVIPFLEAPMPGDGTVHRDNLLEKVHN